MTGLHNIKLRAYIFAAVILMTVGSMYLGSILLDARYTVHKQGRFIGIQMRKNAKNHIKPGEGDNFNSKRKDENEVSIDDVYISVKTTLDFHYTRVTLILMTWWNHAMEQVRYTS